MKKYFWILISLICLLWTSVFATYEDFSNQLKTMWFDVTTIASQNSVSRYDLARLLNIVECKDCIHPDQDMMKKYVQSFWSTFTAIPGKDFGDISFLWGLYNNVSYYYCVAYVGDNTYMRWYPKATSPVCGGQFCGTKNTTTAEFIQVVINILAKYIYKDINLNRKGVNTRVNGLKTDSYEAKNFTSDDKKVITEESKTCDTTCALQNNNEVNIYLKYCMFNLVKCSMQEVGKIKQWYWPVAELNLLYSQSIINIDQNQWINIDKDIDGKTVVDTLFKLNEKVSCVFNNDYDCDGIDNTKDNCPNTYNPHQTDTNHDGIGDVCSDDIDGDGIKNPIGIVDDNGNVDISKRPQTGVIDNCLFVVNTGQQDINHNGIGDACENISNQIALYINIKKLQWSAPLTATFTAISTGTISEINRDFGDGTQGKGTTISHTFISPSMYDIQAIAKGNGTEAKAQVIIMVGGQRGDDKALQTRASVIGGKINTESTLSTSVLGSFDEIEWIFPKENNTSKKLPGENLKRIFILSGENFVLVKWYSNWELAGISYFTMGIGEWRWAIHKSNVTSSEINQKILFDTKTYNITQDDVVAVNRDFGDGTKIDNTTLTMEYTYTQPWKRVVTQTITLIDGKVLTNILTINITDKSLLGSYALLMTPSALVANIGQKINFSTRIIGNMTKNPGIQVLKFADGITQQKAATEKIPNIFVHTYQKNGSLTPEYSMHIDQCTYLDDQATIIINWSDRCLDAKLNGTLKNYKCDMDKDGIPDICSTDIDGDGVPNLLWLINFENKDCSYESDPSKPNANLNQDILAKHYQGVCSLDNAPFNYNPDQFDLNQDGIGDAQKTILPSLGSGTTTRDTDGDGIPDTQDLCPTIQGTINNNGCPEIGQDLWCNQQGISPFIGITNDTLIIKPTDTGIPLATCGNGRIDTWETCANCPQDVGNCTSTCGNGAAEAGENCNNCPADVPSCGICWNGIKDPSEDCHTCPQDYWACTGNVCGNWIIDTWETCRNCPQDVKLCIETPNIWTCNQCPCQFVDFANDLTNNDQVRAILRDKKKTIQYKFSLPWIVDFQQQYN